MELEAGTTLGQYRLLDELGRGGMGFVWRALDTQLDREVALKFLPEAFASDAERVARFEQEAKVLASLNQPNIATIYGYDQVGSTWFLAMELVPGEDLEQRLSRGPLPIDEAVDVCKQIAGALEAAHESGIVHRDLKPANVRITPEGRVKVLDFGLAKPMGVTGMMSDPALSPTMTSVGTAAGMILGSASYMSPEQARARAVDKRTDIWSFGCVLYECLTGKQAFGGETITDSLASVLRSPVDLSALPAETPPHVRELLDRTLVKDPRDRLRDIGDARIALSRTYDSAPNVASADEAAEPRRRSTMALPVLIGAVVAGALLGILAWQALAPAPSANGRPTTRLMLTIPEDEVSQGLEISPDSAHILMLTRLRNPRPDEVVQRAWLRSLDGFERTLLTDVHNVATLGFSPDSNWLYYVGTETPDSSQRFLFKLPVDRSVPPMNLATWQNDWASVKWAQDDTLVVVTASPTRIIQVAADGSGAGTPIPVTEETKGRFTPHGVIPGGTYLVGTLVTFDERGYLHNVAILDWSSGAMELLLENGSQPRWSPTGHLLFTRHDTLMAVPFDPTDQQVRGSPLAILRGLRVDNTFAGALYDWDDNGTLIYWPGGVMGGKRRLVTIDQEGTVNDWSTGRRAITEGPVISRDETLVAVTIVGATGLDETWVANATTRTLRRLVAEPGFDCDPRMFIDDNRLAYSCGDNNGMQWYLRDVDDAGEPELVWSGRFDAGRIGVGISHDGSRFYYRQRHETHEGELHAVDLTLPENDPNRDRLLLTDIGGFVFSPNDDWLCYVNRSSGRVEAYVRPVKRDGSLGAEIPVTTNGINSARWAPQRGASPPTLLFRSIDRRWYSVTLSRAGVSPPVERPWVEAVTEDAWSYRELTDGRLLAILKGEEEKPRREYHVILNLTDELQRTFALAQ